MLKPGVSDLPSKLSNEVKYAVNRVNVVKSHFPSAVGLDDFMFQVEMALNTYGFDGENSIGEQPC